MKNFVLACVLGCLLLGGGISCGAESTLEEVSELPTAVAEAAAAVTEEPVVDGQTPHPTATSAPPTPPPQPTRAVYAGVPTPDPPHVTGEQQVVIDHAVVFGETLGIIADRYGTTIDKLLETNGLTSADFLQTGQILQVPMALDAVGPTLKLIPDSELLYGPTVQDFEIRQFLESYYPQSAIRQYIEEVEGRVIGGADIVNLVAVRYSVNPRLLLAVLEHQSGWVTRPPVGEPELYPLGYAQNGYEGLFQQLNWAANRLNEGFYGRSEGGRHSFSLDDGTRIAYAATINDGTAAVQNWLAAYPETTLDEWLRQTGPAGFAATYERLFGSPFAYDFPRDELFPADLTQPPMELPWEEGVPWYYTSGPHGGWAAGSAWAALDFAPDREQLGCYISETWVTAAAGGLVVFSDYGGLIIDLDGDGDLGTGWTVVYWHLHTAERVPRGEMVKTGDRLGHASCEGGFSNGAHLHLARRYNGRWVSADGPLPFNLGGWVSQGTGREYDGYLVRGEEIVEACACAEDGNEIVR